MSTSVEILPLVETVVPVDQAALAEQVRSAARRGQAIYPLGGGTSLDYGLPPRQPGIGLSLAGLNRVVDYPARDMTITVEAGITMSALAETLAAERQRLPVDAARAQEATLGGMLATDFSGPRRFGYGTLRDYVIGINAVDGQGRPFKAGGRVVKNVAGYDLCKLLVGSLGTVGVITQVTLKIRPQCTSSAWMLASLDDLAQADKLLEQLVTSRTTPVAVELLVGADWRNDGTLGRSFAAGSVRLAVGFEGTAPEIAWMIEQLTSEWQILGVTETLPFESVDAERIWNTLTEFPAKAPLALVLKASVPPSATVAMIQSIRDVDPNCTVQAHAASGVILARCAALSGEQVGRTLVRILQPAAASRGGHIVVYSPGAETGLTRQAYWGLPGSDAPLMKKVKEQFDPQGLLNAGRFVFAP